RLQIKLIQLTYTTLFRSKNNILKINIPIIVIINTHLKDRYLSLKKPQNGTDIIEASGPIANTQPISVTDNPLKSKKIGKKLIIIVFVKWKKNKSNFKLIN